jgi:hypothetical protein
MEDLKRVQEFFSKPLSEKLNLSNPEITDSGLQMHLINLNKELSYYLEKGEASDLRYAEMLKKDIADARAELDKRIKSKKGTNEAQQEDPTDIIAMDVPLFIRMLEYAREDAQTDMDLHNVTERAIEAVKLRGLLSMEDYNDLVGGSEQVDEALLVPKKQIEALAAKLAAQIFSKTRDNTPAINILKKALEDAYRALDPNVKIEEEVGYSPQLVSPENPKGKTPGLTPDTMSKILNKIIQDLDEVKTSRLGEGVIYEELCPKGKAYIKKRMAAGEKSSAYLSGRAVKVCKGQMKG